MQRMIDDVRIKSLQPLLPPVILLEELPITEHISEVVMQTRRLATDIIAGTDDRLIVVVGPCSIHDPHAALEYAKKLQIYAEKLQKNLCVIMRVYFEKPRTTIGWKGLINDPFLDGSFAINKGLRLARQTLLDINNLGLAAGTEFLDTIIPQFISDLISWGAIGARTTESQIHRELASGLSMPVGFKNGTGGNIQIAIDAIGAARHPHQFLSVTKQGIAAIVSTQGNEACHIILRGSNLGANYEAENIAQTVSALENAKLPARIMIDCSHGNSNKDHNRQPMVASNIAEQIAQGNQAICGVMIESHLVAGKQSHTVGIPLAYGQSITDACISWEQTVPVLEQLAHAVEVRRQKRIS